MAKIALLLAASNTLFAVCANKENVKFVMGDRPAEDFIEVTAKNFTPSEQYPTFKDLCTVPKTEAELAQEAEDKAAAAANPDIADAGAAKKTRASAADLVGEYHLVKDLPACAEDHPKFPIWAAIAQNGTVEDAKAACPAVNPLRKTNGVYTFTSEFRYFLKTGYVAMGAAPEVAAEDPVAEAAAA
jgi:hypothetical protein